MALPIYTHIPNLKVLTKIFFKLSRPKGNLCGGGVTVLNPKYPRLLSGDTIKSLPFRLSTAPMKFTDVVNVKLMARNRNIKYSTWLVRATSHSTCLQDTDPHGPVSRTCLDSQYGQSEMELKQVFNFLGYQFDLGEGKFHLNLHFQTLNWKIKKTSHQPYMTTHVPKKAFDSYREASSLSSHMRHIQWHWKIHWRILESPEMILILNSLHLVKMVALQVHCSRSTIKSSQPCSANL